VDNTLEEKEKVPIAPFREERKNWFREKLAYLMKGKLDRKQIWKFCRAGAEENAAEAIRKLGEFMFPDDLRIRQEFRLAAADILDTGEKANGSLDYIADSWEASMYCSWLWDKKGAEAHIKNLYHMQEIIVSNVSYEAVTVMRAKGLVTESFNYYIDQGFAIRAAEEEEIAKKIHIVKEPEKANTVLLKQEALSVNKGTLKLKPQHSKERNDKAVSQER